MMHDTLPGSVDIFRPFSNQDLSSFVAQEARVEIVPRFTLPVVHGVGGVYGPFDPHSPTEVPLWLALYFRQTDTCRISVPSFLSKTYLEHLLQQEREQQTSFEPLHFHFYEISKLLLSSCKDEIRDYAEVMRLLPEVEARRKEKILNSLKTFEDTTATSLLIPAMRLTNLVSMEIHFLRAAFSRVLDRARDLDRLATPLVPIGAALSSTTAARGSSTATTTPYRPSDVLTVADTTFSDVASSVGRPSTVVTTTTTTTDGVDPLLGLVPDPSEAPSAGAPATKKRRTLRQK